MNQVGVAEEDPQLRPYEPPSYWQTCATATSFTEDLPTTTDVAVVGGGLLGAATSYWLARRGVANILIERYRAGAPALISGT